MTQSLRKARVFISCGQRPDEQSIAFQIHAALLALGYDPYVAVGHQTLRGLKENIFERLETSEYLLFVDFRRERLDSGNECRGSLYSHQELAIAAYLDLEVLAYQEEGVRRLDGVIEAIQANAKLFSDRTTLTNIVVQDVKNKWFPSWRRELTLSVHAPPFTDADIRNSPSPMRGRFFDIGVFNHHTRKVATNCTAYISRLRRPGALRDIPLNTVELRWSGVELPAVRIAPQTTRRFNAFVALHPPHGTGGVFAHAFGISSEFVIKLNEPGHYVLEYMVVCDNFASATAPFKLSLDGTLDGIQFSSS
jgi:hypothetical protein